MVHVRGSALCLHKFWYTGHPMGSHLYTEHSAWQTGLFQSCVYWLFPLFYKQEHLKTIKIKIRDIGMAEILTVSKTQETIWSIKICTYKLWKYKSTIFLSFLSFHSYLILIISFIPTHAEGKRYCCCVLYFKNCHKQKQLWEVHIWMPSRLMLDLRFLSQLLSQITYWPQVVLLLFDF